MKLAAIAFALACLVAAPLANAATPPPNATVTIDGVTVSSADLSQLFSALHVALRPDDTTISLAVHFAKNGEMPAYAGDWYYAGTDRSKPNAVMNVWIRSGMTGADLQHALVQGFLLALCDTGHGGPNLQKLYDDFAAKDAALGPNAPDGFVNRRKLAVALATYLNTTSN